MANITPSWMDKPQKAGLHWSKGQHGLGVRVGKSGSKAWIYQKSGGRRVTLGRWPDMDLRQARLKAAELNMTPGSPKRVSLETAHELWTQRIRAQRKSEGTIETRTIQLRRHVGHWMNRAMDAITKEELSRLQVELGVHSAHVANDVLAHLGTLHRLVLSQPWPGDGLKRLDPGEPTRKSIGDIRDWWVEVQAVNSPIVRDALLFAALTGLRKNDILTARHSNLKEGWLHLPQPKGGTRKAFDLPLSSQAMEIVGRQPRGSDWIFMGNKPGQHLTTTRVGASRSLAGLHALRHHWRAVAEVEVGCPYPVVQRLMNHSSGRSVTDAYGRRNITNEVLVLWAQRIADHIANKIQL